VTEDQNKERSAGFDPPLLTALPVEWVPNATVPVIYVNQAEIRMSFYDFMIRMGTTVGVQGEKTMVREDALVAMSPQLVKVLASLLPTYIAAYEKEWGEIPSVPIPQTSTG
jgi:hypothetical protein